MSDFLPQGFTQPKAQWQYLKLQDWESIRLRIISSPIFFWQWWGVDNKPLRIAYDGSFATTPAGADPSKKSQFAWAMVVYNYTTEGVQIWSPTQSIFKNYIEEVSKDPDFGDPKTYDFKISRKGTAMESEYTITALLKPDNMKPMEKDILNEASQINLNALITNDNPFEVVSIADTAKAVFWESKVKIGDVSF